jgi:hypothetical protein
VERLNPLDVLVCEHVRALFDARPSFRRFRLKLVERDAHALVLSKSIADYLRKIQVLKPFPIVFASRGPWFFSNIV